MDGDHATVKVQVAGGVERMAINMMNAMIERGNQVELFTWDRSSATTFYPMSDEIHWYKLDMGDPSKKASYALMFQRARVIRSLVRQQNIDVIVCFQAGPFLAMRIYLLGMGIPIIASERNSPSRFEHLKAGWYRSILFQSFRLAHRITVQCESYRSLYPAYLHDRIVTIPNPVYPATAKAQLDVAHNGRFQLLSVGRLSYQKNYTVLIKAFAILAKEFPAWDLTIVGEGEERPALEYLIVENGLSGRVFLPGTTTEITEYYTNAHIFCLSSRWEGFPNALAEALAHGLPAVGYADCAGVNNLIHCGENGLLVPGNGDPAALIHTLRKIMVDKKLWTNMGFNAITSIAPFAPERIFDRWERVFADVAD